MGALRLTHRSMGWPAERTGAAKKFIAFRFRARALPSWASFPFPNPVGILMKNAKKMGRFYGTLGSQLGGYE